MQAKQNHGWGLVAELSTITSMRKCRLSSHPCLLAGKIMAPWQGAILHGSKLTQPLHVWNVIYTTQTTPANPVVNIFKAGFWNSKESTLGNTRVRWNCNRSKYGNSRTLTQVHVLASKYLGSLPPLTWKTGSLDQGNSRTSLQGDTQVHDTKHTMQHTVPHKSQQTINIKKSYICHTHYQHLSLI